MLIADMPLEVTMAAFVFSKAASFSARACKLYACYRKQLQEMARTTIGCYAKSLERTMVLTLWFGVLLQRAYFTASYPLDVSPSKTKVED